MAVFIPTPNNTAFAFLMGILCPTRMIQDGFEAENTHTNTNTHTGSCLITRQIRLHAIRDEAQHSRVPSSCPSAATHRGCSGGIQKLPCVPLRSTFLWNPSCLVKTWQMLRHEWHMGSVPKCSSGVSYKAIVRLGA